MKYVKVQRKFERSCPPFKRIFSKAKEFIIRFLRNWIILILKKKREERRREQMNEWISNYREKHTYFTQHLLRCVWVPFSCWKSYILIFILESRNFTFYIVIIRKFLILEFCWNCKFKVKYLCSTAFFYWVFEAQSLRDIIRII